MFKFFHLPFLLISLIAVDISFAEPYRPSEPTEVLEIIPEALRGQAGKVFEELREHIKNNPQDIESSLRFVRLCIENGRKFSEPRFFGYAEAEVNRVLKVNDQQYEFVLFRGILRQRNHDFTGAKIDLELAAKAMPKNPQVWATLASVQVVMGDFDQAKSSCVKLINLTSPLVSTSCLALVGSLSGNATKSYQSLETLFQTVELNGMLDRAEALWTISILAEIAERLGRIEDAEQWYKKALSLDADDIFNLAAYADLLLSQKRATDVVTMLSGRENVDPLFLRLVIAEKQSKNVNFEKDKTLLRLQFQNEVARGETTHLREYAIFLLEIEEKSKEAHTYAIKNWNNQKEPIDTLLLARTAKVNQDRSSLNLLRDWQKKNSFEDSRLNPLLREEN